MRVVWRQSSYDPRGMAGWRSARAKAKARASAVTTALTAPTEAVEALVVSDEAPAPTATTPTPGTAPEPVRAPAVLSLIHI